MKKLSTVLLIFLLTLSMASSTFALSTDEATGTISGLNVTLREDGKTIENKVWNSRESFSQESIEKVLGIESNYSFKGAYVEESGKLYEIDKAYFENGKYYICLPNKEKVALWKETSPKIIIDLSDNNTKIVPLTVKGIDGNFIKYIGPSNISLSEGSNNIYFQLESQSIFKLNPRLKVEGTDIEASYNTMENLSSKPGVQDYSYNIDFNLSEEQFNKASSITMYVDKEYEHQSTTIDPSFEAQMTNKNVIDPKVYIDPSSKGHLFKIENIKGPDDKGNGSFDVRIYSASPVNQQSVYNVELGLLTINGQSVAIPQFSGLLDYRYKLQGIQGRAVNDSQGPPYYMLNPDARYMGGDLLGFYSKSVVNYIEDTSKSSKTTVFNQPGVNNGMTVNVSINHLWNWPNTGPNSNSGAVWGPTNNFGACSFANYHVTYKNARQGVMIGGQIVPSSQTVNYVLFNPALENNIYMYRGENLNSLSWEGLGNNRLSDENKEYNIYSTLSKNLPYVKGKNYMKLKYSIPNGYSYLNPQVDYKNGNYDEGHLSEPELLTGNVENVENIGKLYYKDGSYYVNWQVPNTASKTMEFERKLKNNTRTKVVCQYAGTSYISILPQLKRYKVTIDRSQYDIPVEEVEGLTYDVEDRHVINLSPKKPVLEGKTFVNWIFEPLDKNGNPTKAIPMLPRDSFDIADKDNIILNDGYGADSPVEESSYISGFRLVPVFVDNQEKSPYSSYTINYVPDGLLSNTNFLGIPGFNAEIIDKSLSPLVVEKDGKSYDLKEVKYNNPLSAKQAIEIDYEPHITKYNYAINYNSNGGSSVEATTLESTEKEAELKISGQVPTRTGYEFLGWYLGDKKYEGGEAVKIESSNPSITLMAKWKKIEIPVVKYTYSINYDSNGGSSVEATTLESTEKEAELKVSSQVPTRAGYEFLGWYLGDKKYESGEDVKLESSNPSIILTAQWKKIEIPVVKYTYSINYDSNGGSSVEATTLESTEKEAELKVSSKVPTRAGYEFLGWYLGDKKYDSGEAVKLESSNPSITLTAQWKKIEIPVVKYTYSINYDSNGGSGVEATTLESTEKEAELKVSSQVPTRAGYEFLGWYLGDKKYEGGEAVKIESSNPSITLTAKWKKIEIPVVKYTYSINYNSNGGSGVEATTLESTEKEAELKVSSQVPTRAGYEFLGWYLGDKKYDSGEVVKLESSEPSITLTAKWKNIEVKTEVKKPVEPLKKVETKKVITTGDETVDKKYLVGFSALALVLLYYYMRSRKK